MDGPATALAVFDGSAVYRDVCIALMINRFGGECSSRMLRDIGMITITYGKPLALFVAFDNVQSWMALIWILAGAGVVAYAVRRNRPTVLMVFGGMAVAAGWVSYRQALSLEIVLVPEGVLLAATGLLLFIRERLRSHGHP